MAKYVVLGLEGEFALYAADIDGRTVSKTPIFSDSVASTDRSDQTTRAIIQAAQARLT